MNGLATQAQTGRAIGEIFCHDDGRSLGFSSTPFFQTVLAMAETAADHSSLSHFSV
jgi:hypothetical protein